MFFKKFFLIKAEVTKYVGLLSALTYSQKPESTKCPPNILSQLADKSLYYRNCMLNYCNVIVVLLIYQKYSNSNKGSGPTQSRGVGGIRRRNKTETVSCKNAKSIKISYVNNSKLVGGVVINILFVCEIFVIWSCYTKVVDGRGLGQLRPRKLQGQK